VLPFEGLKVDEFKTLTMRKLEGIRCPDHRQAPRLCFQGTTLRDVTIRMTACCDKLAALANQKIAGR
jgi:hypothetical protein